MKRTPLFSDSDDDNGIVDHLTTTALAAGPLHSSRSTMRSLFAENAMQGQASSTSTNMRYEDTSTSMRHYAKAAMPSALPSTSSRKEVPATAAAAPPPLTTVTYARVQAYRGDAYIGMCAVALCVPISSNHPSAFPLLAIVDQERKALTRVKVEKGMQFTQSQSDKQYVSLYDPSFGGLWSLMFCERKEATNFVVSVLTLAHMSVSSPSPLEALRPCTFVDLYVPPAADTTSPCTKPGVSALFGIKLWLLERVGKTSYYTVGKAIEEVPPEAPRPITLGSGQWMEGLDAAAAVGMQAGGMRLCFLPPGHTGITGNAFPNPEVTPADTVVALITCADIASSSGSTSVPSGGSAAALPLLPPPPAAVVPLCSDSTVHTASHNNSSDLNASADTSSLLQRALLQVLTSGPLEKRSSEGVSAPSSDQHATANALDRIERATERVQVQLGNLYEKLDRLDFSAKLEQNNTMIERMVKRVVGQLPLNEVAAEDASKDRDALLATIEKLKVKCEEANNNYQQALAALGPYAERVHRLENDLRVQREALESRLDDQAERHRLRIVEMGVRHQSELDSAGQDMYDQGKAAGLDEGRRLGQQESMLHSGTVSADAWKEKCLQYEQEILRWRQELQESQGRHLRERRGLQSETDSLHLLCERLGMRNSERNEARVPEETTEHQCKRIKRALNAVYSNVESQLLAAARIAPTISVEDTLSILVVAIKSESKVFTQEVRTEASLREEENATIRKVREERIAAASAVADYHAPFQKPEPEDVGALMIPPLVVTDAVTADAAASSGAEAGLDAEVESGATTPPIIPTADIPTASTTATAVADANDAVPNENHPLHEQEYEYEHKQLSRHSGSDTYRAVTPENNLLAADNTPPPMTVDSCDGKAEEANGRAALLLTPPPPPRLDRHTTMDSPVPSWPAPATVHLPPRHESEEESPNTSLAPRRATVLPPTTIADSEIEW